MKITNKIIAGVLVFVAVFLALIFFKGNQKLAYEQDVRNFLYSLNYSALPDLVRPGTYISLDFDNEFWRLNNIFAYTKKGELVNVESKTGVCTELCQATYEFVEPLFGDDYEVSFLKGNENVFFSAEAGVGPTHYVVKVKPKGNFWQSQKSLLIDPSYKIYDYLEDVEGYTFSEEMDSIDVFGDYSQDITMPVGVNYPLLFLEDKEYMLSLAVKKVDDSYNKDNYGLVVFATKKGLLKSSPLIVFMIRDGEFSASKDGALIKDILDISTARKLIDTVFSLFKNISFE